jgi:hypothetical protein
MMEQPLNFGAFTLEKIDRGFVELCGPLGIVRSLKSFVTKINELQSGYIYHYVSVMV